ncbi:histidine--tRNA ligase [Oxobacter pfennigii]|uniref:Histidine--tRNA ligase n=1 Tax=Oxobacter pfennigii TaxID=36849 RepID=A0A0P8YCT0_9CLOT|nr:histidine--tRNA ligase [Oxobacter pfennigii]KPU44980.1 histidine--tRNA ligase [Oxobacter pfennigii]
MAIKAPRGTKDVLPSESGSWQYVEKLMRDMCELYNIKEIRTPTFEHTELVQRGIGETTDIVQKEMYTFLDRSGRSITLKPEGTSPAVRAFIEHNLYNEPLPGKLFYITPVFRYEKPQAGRLREHHQFGIEIFGSKEPSADAEVISLAMDLYRRLKVKNLEININSIGCSKCRAEYNKALKEYLKANMDELCETCKDRFDRNPLRILDCKMDKCKEIVKDAPVIIDYLCEECSDHFEGLKKHLDVLGYKYNINPMIVRGLDYYTKTVFEIISNDIGAQGTVCGGGRYDGLFEECDGPPLPAVGFGMGIERLLLTLQSQNIELPVKNKIDVFIAALGKDAEIKAFNIINDLRKNNISADKDHMQRSLKGQMKYSDKINARYTIILGDDELDKNKVNIKNMETGEQTEAELDKIIDAIKSII